MSTSAFQALITLTKGTSIPTPTGAPSAGTSVVVTDSTGFAQPPVVLTGNETPPWSFVASIATDDGSVTASDLDTSGAVLGTPVTQAFNLGVTPPGNNFLPTTAITVVTAPAAALKR